MAALTYPVRRDRTDLDMSNDTRRKIIIIGAGIVGASLAHHLAGKGASVTVVEAEEVASGVTATSFAWINTSCAGPDPIEPLRRAAIAEYRRLEAEVPGLQLRWTGALCYGTEQDTASPGATGTTLAHRLERGQIAALEPQLRDPPDQASFHPEQGALDAVAATHASMASAQANGADLLVRTPVLGFSVNADRVTGVETTNGTLQADTVVLAAGTGINHLLERFGAPLPIDASPAVFIRYTPGSKCVHTLISNPAMEVRQTAEGALLAAEDYLDDTPQNQPAAIALRTTRAIHAQLAGVGDIEPELACVGIRPMPVDRIPIVGYLPQVQGLYVCTMHPGVTLAAVVGRLASEELLAGHASEALAGCRPARFLAPSQT